MLDPRRPRAVVFDFNGTLCDDERLLFAIFTDLFEEHLGWRLGTGDYFGRWAGRSDRDIVTAAVSEQAAPTADRASLVETVLAERGRRYREHVSRVSPVLELTRDLVHAISARGVTQAIVTGAQRADVEHVLAGAGLTDCFPSIVAEEDVEHGKPDPEGFRRAADTLGTPATNILVLEDSVAGVRAAYAAGMHCVAVTGTHDRATLSREGVTVVDRLTPDLVSDLAAAVDDVP